MWPGQCNVYVNNTPVDLDISKDSLDTSAEGMDTQRMYYTKESGVTMLPDEHDGKIIVLFF